MSPYERDSELRTPYIVTRTFEIPAQFQLLNQKSNKTMQKNKPLRLSRNGLLCLYNLYRLLAAATTCSQAGKGKQRKCSCGGLGDGAVVYNDVAEEQSETTGFSECLL